MKMATMVWMAGVIMAGSLNAGGAGCDGECVCGDPGSCGEAGGGCTVEAPTGAKSAITKSDIKGILFMYEEEKLARDVYRHLGTKWALRPFQNIQRSEQTHMDAMAGLIERYELTSRPLVDDEGEFTQAELQGLYQQLTVEGEASEMAALRVGARVEEIDIEDLDELMAATKNADLMQVAKSLRQASENHLRAFERNLSRRGVDYSPTVLSKDVYEAIIGAESGHGPGSGRGAGRGAGQGAGRGAGQGPGHAGTGDSG